MPTFNWEGKAHMASVGRLDAAQPAAEDKQNLRKVVTASFIGTTIEWYDFFLYGTAAALVFNELFFPNAEPVIGTLAALATYAVGFAARPLGGIVFGHFGDRVGRKSMLVLSLMIMGVATFLIGCLPTHASIGVLAPVLLVLLRFAQGIGVGGEWGGAVLMSVEHAPKGKRGLYGSFPQMGVPAGLALSTFVFLIVQNMTTEAQFMAWGWRIPFLVSIVLVAVGLVIRLKILESPAFKEVKESGTASEKPLVDVVKTHRRDLLTAMGMRIAENGTFYVLTVFVLAYGEDALKLEKNTMLTGVIIAALLGLITIPLYGRLSDRVGRRKLYLAGAVFSLLFAFPFFWLVDTKEPVFIWLAIVLGINIGHDLMYGPQGAYFAELFGTRVRYTGASVGYQLASVFAGGFAPLIAVALLAAADGEPTYVAIYMAVMARDHGGRDAVRTRDVPGRHRRRPDDAPADRALRAQAGRRAGARGSRVTNETVFTLEATPIKFGPGASADAGWELKRLGASRVMVVSDPGIVEAGITGRVVEAIEAAGIEAVVFDRARVEPSAESLQEAADFAVDGDFDGFVGVGGGSSLDTAKVADLVATHPAAIMDYVNAPVGGGKKPPGPLQAAAGDPDDGGHRVGGDDGRRARPAGPQDQERDLAPLPAPAPGHRRPRAHCAACPPRSPPRAGSTSSATRSSRSSPSPTTRASGPRRPTTGRPTRAPTRSPTCGRRRRSSTAGSTCAARSPMPTTSRRAAT